jgi:hypothetical protein
MVTIFKNRPSIISVLTFDCIKSVGHEPKYGVTFMLEMINSVDAL